jgi:hypothetical protein
VSNIDQSGDIENGIPFLKEALFLAVPAVSVIDQR